MDYQKQQKLYETFGYTGEIAEEIDPEKLLKRVNVASEEVQRDREHKTAEANVPIRYLLIDMGVIGWTGVPILNNGSIDFDQYEKIEQAAKDVLESHGIESVLKN